MNGSQINDLRSYSRHWLGEFIDQYQLEECLWQPKHPDYSNHGARNKAYDKLVEKLKEVEPNPDRAMVVRKINSLRSAFRREFRKTNHKSNYETRLWYYDKLLFIAEQKPKRSPETKGPKRELIVPTFEDDSMEFDDEPETEQTATQSEAVVSSHGETLGTITVSAADCVTMVKSEELQQQQQQHQQQHQHHHAHAHATAADPHAQHTAVKVLEITSLDSNSQREIQQAVNSLEHQHQLQQQLQQSSGQTTTIHHQQVPTIQIAREHLQPLFGGTAAYTTAAATTTAGTHRQEDEYDAIGVNVASKLRVMNPTQRIIAEKLISDVLFNAQLDNLTVNSVLSQ